MIVFALSYILFCYILLLSVRNLLGFFFLMKDRERVNLDGRGGGKELGGVGENDNQDMLAILCKKRT